jgi:hypothetical protein
MMGSSDHVSSARKFNKVLSTLKGNSANSSMVAANRVISGWSDPYYEQNDLQLLDPFKASGNLLNIKSNSRKKKNSSRNFMEKLEENMDLALNSDRLGLTNNKDLISLSNGLNEDPEDDYIRKLDSEEIKMPINFEEFDPILNNNLISDEFCIEIMSSTDFKTSLDCSDYIMSEGSPISSGSDVEDSNTGKTYIEFKSLKNTDINYTERNWEISEVEKKLYLNDSQSSVNSDQNNLVKNQKYKLATEEGDDKRSVRSNLDTKFDKNINEIKDAFSKLKYVYIK